MSGSVHLAALTMPLPYYVNMLLKNSLEKIKRAVVRSTRLHWCFARLSARYRFFFYCLNLIGWQEGQKGLQAKV